jgi:glycerol-3-phosphate dehydrogenase
MERNLERLASEEFDVAVIGGGIYGACVAWEAASRGLSVALLEKKDFAWATSANSLKIIHGGFRYLQHADFRRMRQSSLERRTLMRVAPHLVHPLPVFLPTYGHGFKGREVFTLGLLVNHLVTFDRNQRADPQKNIPYGQILSKEEALRRVPGLEPRGLTGGVLFFDAQVYNSERLVLAFLKSAAQAGAALANYAQVTGFLRKGSRITGVQVEDLQRGERLDVRARTVINTAGPWMGRLNDRAGSPPGSFAGLAKAVNLVTRPIFADFAVGLMGQNNLRDRGALVDKGSSFLFVAPWRGSSLLGTAYSAYTGDPDQMKPTRFDVHGLLEEFNRAYPAADLKEEDVSHVHAGLLPAADLDPRSGSVDLVRHHYIHDHQPDGAAGLLSVVGVKYTTARQVAQEVIDRVFHTWGKQGPASVSASKSLQGGEIRRFDEFVQELIKEQPCGLSESCLQSLARNYGSDLPAVLAEIDPAWKSQGKDEALALARAEVRHAVKEEMAFTLEDVLLRRTELGTAAKPAAETISAAAAEMAVLFGWDEQKTHSEIEEVNEIYHITG